MKQYIVCRSFVTEIYRNPLAIRFYHAAQMLVNSIRFCVWDDRSKTEQTVCLKSVSISDSHWALQLISISKQYISKIYRPYM